MQAQLLDGYYEGGQFYHSGTAVQIPGRLKAVLTIMMDAPQQEEKEASTHWAYELDRMIKESTSPPLRIEDFPRMDFGREPISFVSEGENA
jgi:hypothetical protein